MICSRLFDHFKQHVTVKRAEGSGRKSMCQSAKVQTQAQIAENLQILVRLIARNTDLSTLIVHKTLIIGTHANRMALPLIVLT